MAGSRRGRAIGDVAPILAASHLTLPACLAEPDIESGLPCARAANPMEARSSVLQLSADLDVLGVRWCSAVALSTRVVVTSDTCVRYPGRHDFYDRDVPGEGSQFPRARSVYFDPRDPELLCDPARGWAPLEDGSLRTLLAAPVPRWALEVVQPSTGERYSVERIAVSGSESLCSPGIALLRLDEDLAGVPGLPVRLRNPTPEGERVVISGWVNTSDGVTVHDVPTLVRQATQGTPTEEAPPGSLVLAAGACDFDIGGAVVSAETGAVLGVVAWSAGGGCDDSTGNATATRLAPFRHMILDFAGGNPTEIASELQVGSGESAGEQCPESPGTLPVPLQRD